MSPDKIRTKRRRGASLTAAPPPRVATRVFYAVAEGRVTEYDYLTVLQNAFAERCSFRIDMPPQSSRSDDMTPARVVEHALMVAKDDGQHGQYKEIWAIFDRDEHPDVMKAINAVRKHPKIKIAFSHPSFDFWLLLHFYSFNVPQNGHNDDVLSRLATCPGFTGFGRGDKKITEVRAAELRLRIGAAVSNARALAKHCADGRCAHDRGNPQFCGPLEQDPSTGMWCLLESLGVTTATDVER
ncbi:RloB family protein [Nocardia abscessus]|uniref:RloB family protein n=1 Tax=Nocardia abscessus TaxID=120957 RepID=UPI0024547345|nr:RloB family protein [Nocardia abscessus]